MFFSLPKIDVRFLRELVVLNLDDEGELLVLGGPVEGKACLSLLPRVDGTLGVVAVGEIETAFLEVPFTTLDSVMTSRGVVARVGSATAAASCGAAGSVTVVVGSGLAATGTVVDSVAGADTGSTADANTGSAGGTDTDSVGTDTGSGAGTVGVTKASGDMRIWVEGSSEAGAATDVIPSEGEIGDGSGTKGGDAVVSTGETMLFSGALTGTMGIARLGAMETGSEAAGVGSAVSAVSAVAGVGSIMGTGSAVMGDVSSGVATDSTVEVSGASTTIVAGSTTGTSSTVGAGSAGSAGSTEIAASASGVSIRTYIHAEDKAKVLLVYTTRRLALSVLTESIPSMLQWVAAASPESPLTTVEVVTSWEAMLLVASNGSYKINLYVRRFI